MIHNNLLIRLIFYINEDVSIEFHELNYKSICNRFPLQPRCEWLFNKINHTNWSISSDSSQIFTQWLFGFLFSQHSTVKFAGNKSPPPQPTKTSVSPVFNAIKSIKEKLYYYFWECMLMFQISTINSTFKTAHNFK